MPDPILQAAIEEIKPILKKYDCAGVVLLSRPVYMEYLFELSPSWSCITNKGNEAIRFRAMEADYPSKAAQKKAMEASLGLLCGIRDFMRQNEVRIGSIADHLLLKLDGQHWTREERP